MLRRPAVQQVPEHARAARARRAERRGRPRGFRAERRGCRPLVPAVRQEHPLASVRQVAALQPARAATDPRPGDLQRLLDPGCSRLKLPDPRIASRQAEAAGELGPHLRPMITRCGGFHAASVLQRPLEGLVHRPWARWTLGRYWLRTVTAHAGCVPPGSPWLSAAGCVLPGRPWLSAESTVLPGRPWLSAESTAHAGRMPPASAPRARARPRTLGPSAACAPCNKSSPSGSSASPWSGRGAGGQGNSPSDSNCMAAGRGREAEGRGT